MLVRYENIVFSLYSEPLYFYSYVDLPRLWSGPLLSRSVSILKLVLLGASQLRPELSFALCKLYYNFRLLFASASC